MEEVGGAQGGSSQAPHTHTCGEAQQGLGTLPEGDPSLPGTPTENRGKATPGWSRDSPVGLIFYTFCLWNIFCKICNMICCGINREHESSCLGVCEMVGNTSPW